jgi:quercetin dioxygenase-like cupin family protein
MSTARITNLDTDALVPYELDGPGYDLISWLPITYDEATETGTYFFRMKPGAETAEHTHRGFEEYFVIEGSAIESDGRTLRAGDMVSYPPGSRHNTRTDEGCTLIVSEWQPPAGRA